MSNDLEEFMTNRFDFGERSADVELTDDQKRLAAIAMAINATIVQLINEGYFQPDQQIHFMGHLQDFMDRIYHGEGVKMPNTDQTLQVNSKAGNLFFTAMSNAFENGSAHFAEIKRVSQEMVKKMQEENQADPVSDRPKYLN